MSIRWSALVTALGMGSPAMAQDPLLMTAEDVLKAAAEAGAAPPPPGSDADRIARGLRLAR